MCMIYVHLSAYFLPPGRNYDFISLPTHILRTHKCETGLRDIRMEAAHTTSPHLGPSLLQTEW